MFIRVILILLVFWPLGVHAQDRILPESAAQMQMSFAPLVKKVAPAVVNIYTKRTVVRRGGHPFLDDPFFSPFFRDNFFGGRMRKQVENALGSGVIMSADGVVITNAHVIKDAEEITVVLSDGREFPARLTLLDEASDLALLHMETGGQSMPYASLRPSETLEVGDIVLAIGNPFGVGQTVTSGIVSALARSSLNVNDFNFFIQTDAAINPGNSGGPLVALDGGVIGINTAIYSRDGGSLGIGFAIPSEMVASVMAAAERGDKGEGGVKRPWLGVTAQSVTSDIADSLGMERPMGALIGNLHSESPLAKAGLRTGDVVLSLNGRAIRDAAEMKFRMATVPLGGTTQVEYMRKGKNYNAAVKAILPPDIPPRNETLLDYGMLAGASVANLNPAVAAELGMGAYEGEGVVVLRVKSRSAAARVVSAGDILREINGIGIETIADITKALRASQGSGISLVIESNGRTRRIMIR